MFCKNLLRRSSYVHKCDETVSENRKFDSILLKRLYLDHAKAIATAVSATVFCIGLIHNEVKKLKIKVVPMHDMFDFEKKVDPYISAPNYSAVSPPEVSILKTCVKGMMESKSLLDIIPTETLLKCTQSKDDNIRRKALYILGQKRYTRDADILMISQSIDFSTSLYLSRVHNVDKRFFRKPLKLPPFEQSVESELMSAIEGIPRNGDVINHQLIDKIRKRKIHASSHIDKTVMLGFETFDEMGKDSQKTLDSLFIIQLLRASLKYSEDALNCKYLIGRGFLITLRRAYEGLPSEPIVTDLIIKILNNIIRSGADPKLFYDAGWLHIIMHQLDSKCEDVRMNSTKLLINMDLSCGGHLDQFYDNHVYLLHPTHHHPEETEVDIVFIHGLRGGAIKTWRQNERRSKKNNGNNNNNNNSINNSNNNKNNINNNNNNHEITTSNSNSVNKMAMRDTINASHLETNGVSVIEEDDDDETIDINSQDYSQCWPKDWLPQDLHKVRILSVEYDAKLTHWTSNEHIERKTLREQAEILLNSLSAAGVGKRPVVLIGHSMGGILIKQMLCRANEKQAPLTNQVKGIVFYSVPHRGSYLINRTRNASYLLYPTDMLLQLAEGSTDLKDIHDKFSKLVVERSIKMRSFTEGQSTDLPFYMKATIVSQQSSDPGFGDFYVMKDHDHVTICKPKTKNSFLYKLTKDFIKQCLFE